MSESEIKAVDGNVVVIDENGGYAVFPERTFVNLVHDLLRSLINRERKWACDNETDKANRDTT